ncbi:cache domain-containing protein, partial [Pararhodospirillum oryzae]|uniref:cache domain-containing protein n=1 Tax=Pararhodospirillum oryzae TaxID=478448 RepID=UPI001FEA6C42
MQRTGLLEERRALLEEHIASAISQLGDMQGRAQRGELSEQQAQEMAKSIIRSISFGENNYIFINDKNGNTLVNRGAPKVEGTYTGALKDPYGIPFIHLLTEGTAGGQGVFVEYHWPHAGQDKPAPKLGYAQRFVPWEWVIGTGVYMDDVNARFTTQALVLGGIAGLVLLVATAVSLGVVRAVSRPLGAMKGVMNRLSQGDLGVTIPGDDRNDELGDMARALEVFRDNARANKRLQEEAIATEHRQSEERLRARHALADSFEADAGAILKALMVSAEELDRTARTMNETARRSLERAREVRDALTQTTGNVQSVASAAEEMSASVGEISGQVHRSNDVVG